VHGVPLLVGCALALVLAGLLVGGVVLLVLVLLGRKRAPPTPSDVTVPVQRPEPATAPTVPTPDRANGSIVWTGGPLAGRVHRVPPEGFWIGREAPAQVVVAEAEISRLHCWIGPRDGTVVIVDDTSSNGTLVMGEPVGGRVLRDGDVVVLARGAASFRFERAQPERAPTEPPAAGA